MAYGRLNNRRVQAEQPLPARRTAGRAALAALVALAGGTAVGVASCSLGPDEFSILDVVGTGGVDGASGGTMGEGGDNPGSGGSGGSDGGGGAAGGGGDMGSGGSDGSGGSGTQTHACSNLGFGIPVVESAGTERVNGLLMAPHPGGNDVYVAVLAARDLSVALVSDSGEVRQSFTHPEVPLHSMGHMQVVGDRLRFIGNYENQVTSLTVQLSQGGDDPDFEHEVLPTPPECTANDAELRRLAISRNGGAEAYAVTCHDRLTGEHFLYLGPDLTQIATGNENIAGGAFYVRFTSESRSHFIHMGEEAAPEISFRFGPDLDGLQSAIHTLSFTDPPAGVVAPSYAEAPEGDLFMLSLVAEGDIEDLDSAQLWAGRLGSNDLSRLREVPPPMMIPGPSFASAADVALYGSFAFTSTRVLTVGPKLSEQVVSATWLDREGNVLVFDHEVYSSPEFAVDKFVVAARLNPVSYIVAWAQRDALGNRSVRAQRVTCNTTSAD